MAILTKKMLLDSSLNTPNTCVMHLPFNEGSGNAINDIISEVVITDDATAAHTTPHAIIFKATGAITSGSYPVLPNGKSVLMISAINTGNGGGSLSSLFFGIANEQSMGGSGTFGIDSVAGFPATATAAYQTFASGEDAVRIGTFNGVTGLVSSYSSKAGGATQADNTADDSDHLGGFTMTGEAVIGGAIDDDDFFVCAVYFVDTLPSDADILEAGDWMVKNSFNGNKSLPPQFANLK